MKVNKCYGHLCNFTFRNTHRGFVHTIPLFESFLHSTVHSLVLVTIRRKKRLGSCTIVALTGAIVALTDFAHKGDFYSSKNHH
jgi:hypothetical protein